MTALATGVVAFLGPEGTFTHAAARTWFGERRVLSPVATIDAVVGAVREGIAEFGVVPIENSTEGSVNHTLDALIEGGALIVGERVLPIRHALASFAPEPPRIYSHPQAFAQCRRWLSVHCPGAILIASESTVAAVRAALADVDGAAIASRWAAEKHGLPVRFDGIQDRADNRTRFVLLSRHDAPSTGDDKTTLAFALHDAKGALRRALGIFERHELNLCRIESRPSPHRAFEYIFVVDVEGHRDDANLAAGLTELRAHCDALHVLGSYPVCREAG